MPYILVAVKTVSNQPGPAEAGAHADADAHVRSPGPDGGPVRSRHVWLIRLERYYNAQKAH
jgi:hypothetical protein